MNNAYIFRTYVQSICLAGFLVFIAAGCTPGIHGTWDGSGHVGVADRFSMEVVFKSDTRGKIRYSVPGSEPRAIPMCQTRVDDKEISFVIDPSGQTNCSTLARPLRFEGVLGAHVISGQITVNGASVGMWRAYRRTQQ